METPRVEAETPRVEVETLGVEVETPGVEAMTREPLEDEAVESLEQMVNQEDERAKEDGDEVDASAIPSLTYLIRCCPTVDFIHNH